MHTVKVFNISIHAPARGASLWCILSDWLHINFNSRPCERGFAILNKMKLGHKLFQFTPLREGLRLEIRNISQDLSISIHAPARGASENQLLLHLYLLISIHAPARGASRLQRIITSMILFQFTPLREGLRNWKAMCQRILIFQFTPLREGLLFLLLNPCFLRKFQFTPLREGLPWCERVFSPWTDISIHAPARGASASVLTTALYIFISIHAPARGASMYGKR